MANAYLKRLWRFQSERYPIVFLALTTTVFTVTLRHVSGDQWALGADILAHSGLVLLGVLYLGHIRLFDEIRDEAHDRMYYQQRPLPRGFVQTHELRTTAFALMVLELGLVAFIDARFLPHIMLVLALTMFAGRDFFLGVQFRAHFFVYNVVMTIQSLLGLWIIMVVAFGTINFHWTAVVYLALGFGSMIFLEWIRKVRIPEDENVSRDTYSAQVGPSRAAIGGGVILAALVAVSSALLWQWTAAVLWGVLLAAYGIVAGRYVQHLTRRAVRMYQGVCVAIFFSVYGILLLL